MPNIRVDTSYAIVDGSEVVFVAPCSCNEIDGLRVYFPGGYKEFKFKDAHGNVLTGIGSLFVAGAYVKAILDVTNGFAYIQNADTNSYLENRLRHAAPVNLLDNSNFRNPVNQRGETSVYSSNHEYFIDRWKIYGSDASIFLGGNDGNLVIDNGGSDTCGIYQRIEASRLTPGKTYTLAAKVYSEQGSSEASCLLSYSNNKSAASDHLVASKGFTDDDYYKIVTLDFVLAESTDGFYNFRLRTTARKLFVCVDWIALYEGKYTPETLPEYHPKGYAAELLECQRYYYRVEGEISWAGYKSGDAYAFVAVPTQMRATPSVAASFFRLSGTKDSELKPVAASDVSISAGYGNNYRLKFAGTGLSDGQHLVCITKYLELSADL